MSQEHPRTDSEYWARYDAITGERPAWATVLRAIELFAAEGGTGSRFAVDLGCGGGRDARELLKAGWRVLAVDREPAAITAVGSAGGATKVPPTLPGDPKGLQDGAARALTGAVW